MASKKFMHRRSKIHFSHAAVPQKREAFFENELNAYLETLSNVKPKRADDTIKIAATCGPAVSVGASFLKKNTRAKSFKDAKATKPPNLIIDLEDEVSEVETLGTEKFSTKQSTERRSPSTYRLSSTPKSLGTIQGAVFDENPIYSTTGAKPLPLRPVPRRRVERKSSSSKSSALKDGYSIAPMVYNFEEIMSIQGNESDQSQSSSPSLSCSNSSSKNAKHLHVPFIRTEDSGSASLSKEGTAESAGEYSDDFESSDDEEADERSSSLSNASKREHNAAHRVVIPGASSSNVDTPSLVQSSPASRHSDPDFVKDVKTFKKLAIKKIGESKFCTPQRGEKRISRNVGVMTDAEPRQPPPPPLTNYYDQNAFAASVTAAVEHIIARHSGPRPILSHSINTRNIIDALTAHSPCLAALDNALREQLQITQTFLSTQRAMHDALKAALHKCLVPPLEPVDLRLNYTLRTRKEP